jgi:hypothetical protein
MDTRWIRHFCFALAPCATQPRVLSLSRGAFGGVSIPPNHPLWDFHSWGTRTKNLSVGRKHRRRVPLSSRPHPIKSYNVRSTSLTPCHSLIVQGHRQSDSTAPRVAEMSEINTFHLQARDLPVGITFPRTGPAKSRPRDTRGTTTRFPFQTS